MATISPRKQFLQPNSLHESKLTLGSLKSDQDAHDLRDIFSPAGDINERGRPRNLSPARLNGSMRTKTNSSLSILSSQLRKRFSRDSNFSKTSSGANKVILSEEETERRRELKRALYERVRTEIFQDGRESCAGCDPDAKLIATPATVRSTKHSGDITISPLQLSKVMRKLDLAASEKHEPAKWTSLGGDTLAKESIKGPDEVIHEPEFPKSMQHESEKPIARNVEATPMVFKKISVGDMLDCPIIRKRSTFANLRPKMSIFELAGSCDPLHHESKDLLESSTDPEYIEISLSPDLLPLRLPSASASERASRLSRPLNEVDQQHPKDLLVESRSSPRDNEISEGDWLRGASRVPHSGHSIDGDTGDVHEPQVKTGRACNPVTETRSCGIGGEEAMSKLSPSGPPSRTAQSPLSRRNVSRSSSTQRSSITSPLMSMTSGASVSGSNRNSHSRNRRGSSQRKSFSQGSSHAIRSRQTSNSIDQDSTGSPRWLPVVRDNASSVYASQAGSLMPSPNGSFIRPPSLFDRLRSFHPKQKSSPIGTTNSSLIDLDRLSVSPLDSLEAELRRRSTAATNSSFQSSTDSLRARELAASELRIVSRSKKDSLPRQSRFKEELDLTVGIREESPDLLVVPQMGLERISMDGSEDWYSSGRRSGYGFAFLPGENAAAAESWERALRATAEQNSLVSRRLSSAKQSSKSFQSQLAVHQAKKRLSLLSTADTNYLTVEPRRNRFKDSVEYLDPLRSEPTSPDSEQAPGELPDQPVQVSHPSPPQPPASPPKRYADSWTRFPSHSRPARCFTPAGAADNVKSHDFALDYPVHKSQPAESRKLSDSKAKTKSMHFGKAFKSIGNLYKSQSANFSRFEHGYRSSISAGGILKYPELEIPQPLAPTMPSLKEQRLSTDSGVSEELFQSVENDRSEVSRDQVGSPSRNAKVWSRLYEDCVEYPANSEAGSMLGSPVLKRAGRVLGMSRSCG